MPALWCEILPGKWHSQMLEGDVFFFGANDPEAVQVPLTTVISGVVNQVLLRRVRLDAMQRWVLLTGAHTRVRRNGDWLVLGLTVLADRDEIVVGDADAAQPRRFYFSTERVAGVESAPEQLTASCPRCKQPVESGSAAVCCPLCQVWHHEESPRHCWTYAARCAACHRQPTELDGQLCWTPEEI